MPAPPTLKELQVEVRELLRAAAVFPPPAIVRRLQHRILSRVDDELDGTDHPRLYVLEIAGTVPRVKIGVSTTPGHVSDSTSRI